MLSLYLCIYLFRTPLREEAIAAYRLKLSCLSAAFLPLFAEESTSRTETATLSLVISEMRVNLDYVAETSS